MTKPTVAIIILAAGGSNRMRIPKQLLPFRGKNMLRHAIDEADASEADFVFAVLGANAERIQRVLRPSRARIVMNSSWKEGISSSIRAGITALPSTAGSAIISLCDQPYTNSRTFNSLIDTFHITGKSIVACEYAGTVGTPSLFSRKYFDRLAKLEGDFGAKRIIIENNNDVARIPFVQGTIDIDTAEDYQRFIKTEMGIKK